MKTLELKEYVDKLTVDGGKIYPFYPTTPEQYVVGNTQYAVLNRHEFMSRRGIENATLSSLADYLPDGVVIAGGFMISALYPKHVTTDIDMFFLDSDAFLSTYDMLCNPPDIAEAWAWRGYKTNVSRAELLSHSGELRTVTFTNEDPTKLPIQLIKMIWFSKYEHVIDSFDFTVCQFSATREDIIFNPVSWVDLYNQELIVHKGQAPVETLYRIIKYVKKGYKTSHRTLINVCENIRDAKELQTELPVNIAKYA